MRPLVKPYCYKCLRDDVPIYSVKVEDTEINYCYDDLPDTMKSRAVLYDTPKTP